VVDGEGCGLERGEPRPSPVGHGRPVVVNIPAIESVVGGVNVAATANVVAPVVVVAFALSIHL
jgi:hypothetical protein